MTDSEKLAELTAILGDEPVGRAKALISVEESSIRLSEARAAGKKHVITHEDLEHLIGQAKRSGYVSAIGALHNALVPFGFSEPDTDKVIAKVHERECAAQDLRCFALNVAWQNGWAATVEEADSDDALDFVATKLRDALNAGWNAALDHILSAEFEPKLTSSSYEWIAEEIRGLRKT